MTGGHRGAHRFAIALACLVGCGSPPGAPGPSTSVEANDEIPADRLGEVLAANRLGIGYLEQFEYAKAVEQFRLVRRLAPGWIAGSINLSIALLNDSGTKSEGQKKGGADEGAVSSNFTEALTLLDDVLKRAPKNLHAHYCRGLILQYLMADPEHPDNLVRAHEEFQAVVDADPKDGHALYKLAETLYETGPDGPRPAGPDQLDKRIALLNRVREANPYLVAALHQLQLAYGQKGDRAKQTELIDAWKRLNPKMNPAASGEMLGTAYGEVGRYAEAIDPVPGRPAVGTAALPHFDTPRPLDVALPAGDRWVKASDFVDKMAAIGHVRDRFGATVASFDADGDGRLDLYLAAAVVGPRGVRDALLLNRGNGSFVDATETLKIPTDRASLGVAAADFDADRRVDLFLTGIGDNRLLRNAGKDGFVDVTKAAGIPPSDALSLTARWMDLDQDGDLDLYVINHTKAEHANPRRVPGPGAAGHAVLLKPPGLANSTYRNDGRPPEVKNRPADNWAPVGAAPADLPAIGGLTLAFTPWPDPALGAGAVPHTAVAVLDIDNDRDLDLVVSADGEAPVALLNDRLGAFRSVELPDLGKDPVNGLLVLDLDKDGTADLVAPDRSSEVRAWRNTTPRDAVRPRLSFAPVACDAQRWRTTIAADVDLDTWTDLVGSGASDGASPYWVRNREGKLQTRGLATVGMPPGPVIGLGFADLIGDPLPDLLTIRDGEAPQLTRNLGNGNRWVALGLGGRWKTSFDHMRTNSEGLGTRISIEGQGVDVEYTHTTPEAGLSQSAGPVVLGLGSAKEITLLHLRWPDGVLQCELNLPVDTTHAIAEYNRKTGSCPVLFTWNGDRFVCIGDFLGGGGLGYLVSPGVYGQPDRDEAVAIAPDQLKPVDGIFRLSVSEPMDEIAYLDRLTLDVVDRPPGVSATPDERFAPEGPRPSGRLIAWSRSVAPIRVTDHKDRDISPLLSEWDRRTADGFNRLRGWIGYAEDHAITLDFGDRLKGFGAGDRLVLCLAGWVEYPYSQTNYAAATAGVALKPPVLERLGDDGTWAVIDPHPGYPAGLPRMMTVDLTGKVHGGRCVLRIRTNMECYWDQAFVAVADDAAKLRSTTLDVARATLGYRGYTREVSPDGRLPLLYDYDYVDPAPLARLSGNLTRYGDVAALLREDDDRLCLVGPGDEVRLEFEARELPELPKGWTRSYVLRSVGYCKDADPFTATSDRVGPLPWKGMPEFPFKGDQSRPIDPAYTAYLRDYQTRPAATR